ncbi:DUF4375 domain-containing protein [Sphingobacterium sp. Lzh-3]|uniref:DMP19 family protein n=1 Tax=Sphingobacterium sp. Lzh-3 TaxID=3382150 RepID=UPI00398D0728
MIKSMRTPIITIGIIIMILNLFGCSERTKQNNNKPSIQTPLTEQIIDTTSDDMLLEVVYDNLFRKLSATYDKEYEIVLSWNKSRQAIYMISQLEAEVNNGGYNQFYFNSSGQFAAALLTKISFRELVESGYADFVLQRFERSQTAGRSQAQYDQCA